MTTAARWLPQHHSQKGRVEAVRRTKGKSLWGLGDQRPRAKHTHNLDWESRVCLEVRKICHAFKESSSDSSWRLSEELDDTAVWKAGEHAGGMQRGH